MILYIHGLGSGSECSKCLLLQKYTSKALIPTLDLLDVSQTLSELETVMHHKIDIIVGASFGGFYAQYFAKKYRKAVVLINPVNEPLKLMQAVDLADHDSAQLMTKLTRMSNFMHTHAYSADVEVLIGLYDDVIVPIDQHIFFSRFSCKYYADDHRLLEGFGSYLKQSGTLLSKYL